MNKLLRLQCSCCGGQLNQKSGREYVCGYCGTKYLLDKDNEPIRIETFQNPVRTLAARYELTREAIEAMGNETAAEIAMKHITRGLADSLAPFMRIENEYDPCMRRQIITARVRLVEDAHEFY